MDDELMRLFAGERIQKMMEMLNLPDETPIQNGMISNSIESAQKKVEGRNFDIRKHLVEYDDVNNKHREIIYSRRRKALFNDNIKNDIVLLMEKEAERIVQNNQRSDSREYDCQKIMDDLSVLSPEAKSHLSLEQLSDLNDEESLIEHVKTFLFSQYEQKEAQLTNPEILRRIEKAVSLSVLDRLWMDHIDNMQNLRESVSLRGYGQRDPLIEFKEQAYLMFVKMLTDIQANTVSTLFRMNLQDQLPAHLLKPSAPAHQQLITNADSLEGNLQSSGLRVTTTAADPASSDWAMSNQPANSGSENQPARVVRTSGENSGPKLACDGLGRNDICPKCGVKAKKCPYKK
jgi:preprotein translocase subunit SecA